MTFPFYLTLRLQQSLTPLTLRQLYTIAIPQTLSNLYMDSSTVFYMYIITNSYGFLVRRLSISIRIGHTSLRLKEVETAAVALIP